MDKKWIGIIIILIAGIGCMYLIASNSTTVGSAVSVVNDVTISIPSDFISSEDGANFCVLFDKATNETVRVRCLEDGSNHTAKYNENLKSLKGDSNIVIGKHFTNDTLSWIDYENLSSTDKRNNTVVYFDKCNHTFLLKLEHFTKDARKEYVVDYIIKNAVFDFKQKKS